LSGNGEYDWVALKNFELFGEIIQTNATLQNLMCIPQRISIPSIIQFPYQKENHFGLFHHFQNCSIKNIHQYFCCNSSNSMDGFNPHSLTEWNNTIWISKPQDDCRFYLEFKPHWVFKLTGYRLKSGDSKFLRSWKFCGSNVNVADNNIFSIQTVLDQQKDNISLSSIFGEESFVVSNEIFCDSFEFYLDDKNSEGTMQICLSAFEIFGELRLAQ
jgi:hypothetical protein